MLPCVIRLKAVFAAQFPAGFLGNGFAQHLTPAFIFRRGQGFDACRRFVRRRIGVELNRHIRAANQLDRIAQGHIAFAFAVGAYGQAVIVTQD
ncbi:Uncharacterised protein [Neisseria meningitidis]|nr:Uncharacterised protein [Neisseria meningitidis]CWO29310.1 Uncharacterised protein [Neisseria meningitidis]CWR68475.1 Uncharacterised protein [Neisseria meningitidis]CWR99999.1 Uncharacterised protein [Neisseria meningitidis]